MAHRISLLADQPELIADVATMRWQEWGHPPEPEDPAWWLDATAREAGRAALPITFVASGDGAALGAVGLGQFDIEERRDLSPWVLGLIVRPDCRGTGVGLALMDHLTHWAAEAAFTAAWAATAGAEGFYSRCGWTATEKVFCASQGQTVTVLRKTLV
jgi:predicted N-acetyltransferase YhbS